MARAVTLAVVGGLLLSRAHARSGCNASTLLDVFTNATLDALARWNSVDDLPDAGWVPYTATRCVVIASLARIDAPTAAAELSALLAFARPDGSLPGQIYPAACVSSPTSCSPAPSTWYSTPNASITTSSLRAPPLLATLAADIFYRWLNATGGSDTGSPLSWLNAIWPALYAHHVDVWATRVAPPPVDLYTLFTPLEAALPHHPTLTHAAIATGVWNGTMCASNATWGGPPAPTEAMRALSDWPGSDAYAATWCVTTCVLTAQLALDASAALAACPFRVVSVLDHVLFTASSRALADLGRWATSSDETGGAGVPSVQVDQAETWASRAAVALGAIATPASASDDDDDLPLFFDLNLTALLACGGVECARLPQRTLAGVMPLLLSAEDTATWPPTWRARALSELLSTDFAPPFAPTLSRRDVAFNASSGWGGGIMLPVMALLISSLTATGNAGALDAVAASVVEGIVRGMCAAGGDDVALVLDADSGMGILPAGQTLYSCAGAPAGVLLLTPGGNPVPPPIAAASRAGLITAMTIELLFVLSAAVLCVFLGARTLAQVHAEAGSKPAGEGEAEQEQLLGAYQQQGDSSAMIQVEERVSIAAAAAVNRLSFGRVAVAGGGAGGEAASINGASTHVLQSASPHPLAATMLSATPRVSLTRAQSDPAPPTAAVREEQVELVEDASVNGDGDAFIGVRAVRALWAYLGGSAAGSGGEDAVSPAGASHGYSAFRDIG